MKRFYFTYGSEGYDFVGGWTEVTVDAPDTYNVEGVAVDAFDTMHPRLDTPEDDPFIRCAGIYTEEEFKKTSMYENGNLGHRCHEQISYIVKRCDDER